MSKVYNIACSMILAVVFNSSPATGSQNDIVRRMKAIKDRHSDVLQQLAKTYPNLTHFVNSSCTERYSLLGGSIPSVDTCNSLAALHQITRSLHQITNDPSIKQQMKAFNSETLRLIRSYKHYLSSHYDIVCPHSDGTGSDEVSPRSWRHEFESNWKQLAEAKFQLCKLSKNAQFYLYPSYSTMVSLDFQQWCRFIKKCQ